MREKQTIEFSLRLFTLRVRLIGKRTLMQNKNFVTWQKMTQQQVEMKKNKNRARIIFSAGRKSGEKYNTGHEKKSWAKPKFLFEWECWSQTKIIPKKAIKKHSSNKNYSPTNETDVETLEKLN